MTTTSPSAGMDVAELEKRLRDASLGTTEWRVQDPKDKSYCISYKGFHGEHQARDWLADHKRRFPYSQFAGFEVESHLVQSRDDLLRIEAADALQRLAAEVASEKELADVNSALLDEVRIQLGIGGKPGSIVEAARKIAAEVAELRAKVDRDETMVTIFPGLPQLPQWVLSSADALDRYMREKHPGYWSIGGVRSVEDRAPEPPTAEPQDAAGGENG